MLLYASITIVKKIRNFVREKIYKWGVSTPFYIHHSEMLKLEIVHFNLISFKGSSPHILGGSGDDVLCFVKV